MTTYHRNYLSPESQPWARDVEDRLLSIEQANALTAQETNNTLLQLNSSVQLLSQQVVEIQTSVDKLALIGLSTASTTNGFSRITNGTTSDLPNTPSLTINLTRSARVLVTGSAIFQGDAGDPTSNVNLAGNIGWRTNYDALVICQNLFNHQVVPSANFSIYRASGSTSASQVITVPAGTLDIYPTFASITLAGGGGGNMIMQASPITLSAVVLPD